MAEALNTGVEIKPARLLRSPRKLAMETGGKLTFRDGKLYGIEYKSGTIIWADHPRKRSGVHEATPFLKTESPRRSGSTLGVDVAVLTEGVVTFVGPGMMNSSVISGYSFAHGDFTEFSIPTALVNENLIHARDMARVESERYLRISNRRATATLKKEKTDS